MPEYRSKKRILAIQWDGNNAKKVIELISQFYDITTAMDGDRLIITIPGDMIIVNKTDYLMPSATKALNVSSDINFGYYWEVE